MMSLYLDRKLMRKLLLFLDYLIILKIRPRKSRNLRINWKMDLKSYKIK